MKWPGHPETPRGHEQCTAVEEGMKGQRRTGLREGWGGPGRGHTHRLDDFGRHPAGRADERVPQVVPRAERQERRDAEVCGRQHRRTRYTHV